jgi:16S rRNA (cytidine1402-2'-O)-methyltransferase
VSEFLNTGKLVILGTPIGNLNDFSPRAQEALKSADFIAAEDTRVTRKLLSYFGISKPLTSYYEQNKHQKAPKILEQILDGKTCVLVSDAGMPAISDPGENLVSECAKNKIKTEVVPGPSAVTAALAVCGLPTGRFTFEGFLSTNKKSRTLHLEELKTETRTMVFYEAPHKLKKTLCDLFEKLGQRRLTIAREITKIHEEIIHTTLQESIDIYQNQNPRGEFTLVVEGAKKEASIPQYTIEQAVSMANDLLDQNYSKTEASKIVAKKTKIPKSQIYARICEDSGIRDLLNNKEQRTNNNCGPGGGVLRF